MYLLIVTCKFYMFMRNVTYLIIHLSNIFCSHQCIQMFSPNEQMNKNAYDFGKSKVV